MAGCCACRRHCGLQAAYRIATNIMNMLLEDCFRLPSQQHLARQHHHYRSTAFRACFACSGHIASALVIASSEFSPCRAPFMTADAEFPLVQLYCVSFSGFRFVHEFGDIRASATVMVFGNSICINSIGTSSTSHYDSLHVP